MVPLWAEAERFVAGVGDSSNSAGLIAFAFGRVADTWDVPVLSVATRNTTTQHLFHVETSILERYRIAKKAENELCAGGKKKIVSQ